MKFRFILLQIIFVNFCLLSPLLSHGQENEAELKSMAEKTFRAENYVEASKLYSQLLSINRDDAFYNYRYGVCLLYNSRKKIDAIKHLTYASKMENFDPEVFFYLGKAYHLNYEFGEAIQNYNQYKSKAGAKVNVTLNVNRQIEMSESGKRLLSSANEIIVLDKKEIESPSFFRIYELKDIGGDILVNAQFQSKIDKKYKHTPIIHFPAKPTTIYYSSYGEDDKNGKDIFIRRKLPDGSWSLPQTINGGVNTKFDEDFPYMHPNGKYLYFSSKGHNSMGGYDVFRSKFDKENNTFGPPENLDFTISSPDDDLFYVVDSLDKNAYFASARQSLDGKIHVYKVRVEQVPIQIAVIKAAFSSTIRPENKKVTVDIFDFASNAKIGTFNSNEKGNVLMTFPKGGKYEYQVKVDGVSTTFKSVINVPFLNEFKPLKQKLIHEQVADKGETVTVVNQFDQAVEDQVATMAEIARIRSELNPNSEQFDLKKLDNSSENQQLYAELGFSKQGDREVQENIQKLADTQEKQTETLSQAQQKAVDKVMENASEIKQLQADLKNTVAQSEMKSGNEKKALIEKAAGIVNELNAIDEENRKLLNFADSLNTPIAKNKEEGEKARKLADDVKKAFDEGNTPMMAQKLSENKAMIKQMKQEPAEPGVKDILTKRDEIKKLSAKQKEYLDMKIAAKNELLDLDIKLAEAKSKEQPAIEKKIKDKQEEIKMIDEELKVLDPKMSAKKEELKKMEEKLVFVQEIQNSKAPASKTSAGDAAKNLATLENPNTRTLKSYVAEQSKQLGIDMTAQKMEKTDTKGATADVARKELNGSQKELASQLTPDYLKNKEAIKNDKELGEEQRLKFDQKEDKNLKFQVSKEINMVKDALKQNPNNASLQNRLKALEDLNESLNQNIAAAQSELHQKFPESNPEKKITDKQMANRVKPNHFAVLSILEDEGDLSENQRLDKAQKEDQEFIRLLNAEKNKIEEKLKKDPANETAQHELSLVKDLLKETDSRIERRTMGMASFQVPDNKTDETYIPKNTKSDSLNPESNLADNKTDNKNPETNLGDNKTNKTDNKTPETNLADNKTDNKNPETNLGDNKTNKTDNKTPETNLADNKTDIKNPETNLGDNKTNKTDNKTPETNLADNKTDNKNPETNLGDNKTNKTDNKTPETNLADNKTDIKNPETNLGDNKTNKTDNKTPETNLADNKTDIKNPETNLGDNKTNKTDNKTPETNLADNKADIKNPETNLGDNKTVMTPMTPADYEAIKVVSPAYEKTTSTIKNNPSYDQKLKNDKLIIEENKLQKNIETEVAKLDAKLAKNPSDTIASGQKERLSVMKQDSENRENESKQIVISEVKETIKKDQLIASADKGYQKEITSLPPDQSIAREEKLQENLQKRISANEKRMASSENLTLQAENQVLHELVDESKGRVETIKNPQTAGTNTSEKNPLNTTGDQKTDVKTDAKADNTAKGDSQATELNTLQARETELKTQLADPKISKTDEEKLNMELAGNQQKQMTILGEKTASQAKLVSFMPLNKETVSRTDQPVVQNDSLALGIAAHNDQKIAGLQKELVKTKKESKKAELVEQITSLQAQNAEIYEDVAYSRQTTSDAAQLQAIDPKAGSLALESKTSLEKRKTALGEESQALKTQMENDKLALKKAKSDDKTMLARKIVANETRIKLLEDESKNVESELKNRQAEENKNTIAARSKVPYTEEEKKQLSASATYGELKTAFENAEQATAAKARIYTELEEAKSRYAEAVAEQAKNPSAENQERVKTALIEVLDLSRSYNEESEKQAAVWQVYMDLSMNETDLAKLESLFTDGIGANYVPVEEKTDPKVDEKSSENKLIVDNVPFKILEVPQETAAEERIKVGEEMPMGLIYRVQVGAFRKPLKSKMYAEFTPVTGEPIKEGITRYITGYFGSVGNASKAKRSIRNLGYRDAFIVAYCDGKRISLAKAKKLQASGQCVPNPTLDQQVEIASGNPKEVKTDVKTDVKAPVKSDVKAPVKTDTKTDNKTKSNLKTDYNKAAGAVNAIAVETKLGLFYTVQIGAYRKPATSKQLKYVENVVSKLLADGMIRYSTGIFPSVEAAIPAKSAAVQKGITDAFVTAYYNGERITLAEADRLLKEKGAGILEKP